LLNGAGRLNSRDRLIRDDGVGLREKGLRCFGLMCMGGNDSARLFYPRGVAGVGGVGPLNLDLVSDVPGVVPHSPDKAGSTAGLPGQAEEIDSFSLGHAPLVDGASLLIEGVNMEPGVVLAKSRSPDNRGDTGCG